jgi:carbohydrate diacid regulator
MFRHFCFSSLSVVVLERNADFMLTSTARFSEIASLVTDRIAKLLFTPVFVTDQQGVIISSTEPQWVGMPFTSSDANSTQSYLRLPLRYDIEVGEVIVSTVLNHEFISPRLAQVLVELVIDQTATQEVRPNRSEQKNQLIRDLLHDRIEDEALILCRAKRLGIDLNPPRAVILIDAAEFVLARHSADLVAVADQQRRAQTVINSIISFFLLPNDTICASLGAGKIAVLKASDTKNLDPWADFTETSVSLRNAWANLTALRRAANALLLRLRNDTGASVTVGIGRYHPGLRGLARSYEEARAALSLGCRFHGQNQVHCLGKLGIAAFIGVADECTKVDLAKYLLGPLDHEPELLTTLDTFFTENCCPSSVAKSLSIHRNTLSYRLDKITSLTGLDPRQFDDAVQMRLALLLRSWRSEEGFQGANSLDLPPHSANSSP